MQKHSRQVLRSSRLKTRLGGSVSLIVQDPDNLVKSAVRGFPQRKGDENKLSWNRRDRRFNGNNALRRIRRKCGWEDPVGHDGGMPRRDEEAACRGFRHIHVNARLSKRATSKLAEKHARELVECGIAVPSDSVPLSRNVPFTVYEERERRGTDSGSSSGQRAERTDPVWEI